MPTVSSSSYRLTVPAKFIIGMIGAVSNNSRKLSVLVGIYKGVQSAGAAVGWRLDAQRTSYMAMFSSTWGLLGGGLLLALPMIIIRVQDHTWVEEDVIAGIDAAGHVVDDPYRRHSTNSRSGQEPLDDSFQERVSRYQQHHIPLRRTKER
jgi:hypothetical protein